MYLGDKPVAVYKVLEQPAPIVEKFGMSVDDFIGDVTTDGSLQWPNNAGKTIYITGIVHADVDDCLSYKYCYQFGSSPKEVHFMDLESANGAYALGNMFLSCSGLRSVYFHKLSSGSKTCLSDFIRNCDSVEVHFPAASETFVTGLTGYSTGWRAANYTILFDL